MKPLVGKERVLISLALAAATFMQALDSSIANVAIPTISGDLGVSATQGTWVITSFTVSNAIALPLTGWLARRIGEVKLFVIAVALFTIASLGCGLATNIGMLIAFRVLQGVVAGPMTPMSQTLLLSIYPPEKKGLALALWSMTTLVGPICGPILGGVITDSLSWPWIFYINLPIGLLCTYVCWSRLHTRETKTVKQRIDGVGLALLVLGIGSLQLMLDQGRELDWFNSPEIIALAVVAAISLTALIIWELTEDQPIVDLHLFGSRNFAIGTMVSGIAFMGFFGLAVILPLWLQTQMGYTATWAGWVMAPTGVLAILLMPTIGRNVHRMDVRKIATFSFLVFAICSFWRANFNTDVTIAYVLGPQWLQGVATACLFVPMTSLILAGMRPDQIASAAGLSSFIRILSGSFGTSLTTTFWDRRAAIHHATLVEYISPYNTVFKQTIGLLRNNTASAYAIIEQLITRQAYMLATVDIFWIFGWTSLCAIPLLWLARPTKNQLPAEVIAAAE